MKFVRAIWKLLVGVKDALVLVFMILFFAVLYGALSARPAPIGDGVLAMQLSGSVVEQRSSPSWAEVAGGSDVVQEHRLRDLLAALDSARRDDRVKAVALDLESFTGGGQAALTDLADAVRSVRESGKPVIAYATGYSDDSYLVASAASEIWMNPLGGVLAAGPGGQNLYFKGLLDKLGVTANIYRAGTYKAAVEPFERNDMSPEAEQNAQALGNALLGTWQASVARNRPKAKVQPYMANPVGAVEAAGGDMARAALAAGLVDKLADREAFEARLAQLGGDDETAAGYRAIELGAYIADRGDVTKRMSARSASSPSPGPSSTAKPAPGTAGGDTIADAIDEAVSKGGLKALVVRVEAPAGRSSRPSGSARPSSTPSGRRCRWSCRWAASRHRAATGLRRRPTSSSPSRRPSPVRSACSESCRALKVAPEARDRRRRGQDDAAVGGAGPAQRSFARSRPADPGRGQLGLPADS